MVGLRWGKFSHSFQVLLAGLNTLLGYMMGKIIDLIVEEFTFPRLRFQILLSEAFEHNMQCIANALLWVWKRQSHHPSRLGNTSRSIHLGNSALTCGRLQSALHNPKGIHSHSKYPRFLTVKGCVLFWCCHPWQSAKTLLSGPRQEKYPALYENLQGPLLCGGQWIRIFLGPQIQLAEVYAEAQTSDLLPNSTWQCYTMGFG